MAQILQGLCHKVCSTIPQKFFAFESFILVFGKFAIIHQQLLAMLRGHLRSVYGTIRAVMKESCGQRGTHLSLELTCVNFLLLLCCFTVYVSSVQSALSHLQIVGSTEAPSCFLIG